MAENPCADKDYDDDDSEDGEDFHVTTDMIEHGKAYISSDKILTVLMCGFGNESLFPQYKKIWRPHGVGMIAELVIRDLYLKAKVRKTVRLLNSEKISTIEVISVEVIKSAQRMGNWTQFLSILECFARETSRCVYIECVNNPFLLSSLQRKNYIPFLASDPSTVFKKV